MKKFKHVLSAFVGIVAVTSMAFVATFASVSKNTGKSVIAADTAPAALNITGNGNGNNQTVNTNAVEFSQLTYDTLKVGAIDNNGNYNGPAYTYNGFRVDSSGTVGAYTATNMTNGGLLWRGPATSIGFGENSDTSASSDSSNGNTGNNGYAIAYTSAQWRHTGWTQTGNGGAWSSLQVFVRISGDLQVALKKQIVTAVDFNFIYGAGALAEQKDRAFVDDDGDKTETYFDINYFGVSSATESDHKAAGSILQATRAENQSYESYAPLFDSKKYNHKSFGVTKGLVPKGGSIPDANNTPWDLKKQSTTIQDNTLKTIGDNGGFWVKLYSRAFVEDGDSAAHFGYAVADVLEGVSLKIKTIKDPSPIPEIACDTSRGTATLSNNFATDKITVATATANTNNFFVRWDSVGAPIYRSTLITTDLGYAKYTAAFRSIPVTGASGTVDAGPTITAYYGQSSCVPTLPDNTAAWGENNNVNIGATRATIRYHDGWVDNARQEDGTTAEPITVGKYTMSATIYNASGAVVGKLNQFFQINKGTNESIATPTVRTVTFGDTLNATDLPSGWVWTGATAVNGGVTWSGTEGTFKTQATWRGGDNYFDVVRDIYVKVEQKAATANITFNGVTFNSSAIPTGNDKITWKYDPNKTAPVLASTEFGEAIVGSPNITYYKGAPSIGKTLPTAVGDYTAEIKLTGTNYKYSLIVVPFSIIKYSATDGFVTVDIPSDLVYGDTYKVEAAFTADYEDMPAYNGTISFRFIGLDNDWNATAQPSNAGTYKVEITMGEDTYYYAGSTFTASKTLVIAKATGEGEVSIANWRFGKTAPNYVAVAYVGIYSAPVIEYSLVGEDNWSTEVPTGENGETKYYQIRATWAATTNFEELVAYGTFNISCLPEVVQPDGIDGLKFNFNYGDEVVVNFDKYFPGYNITVRYKKVGTSKILDSVTNAGQYLVIITVEGTDTTAETKFECVTLVLAKATGVITLTNTEFRYGNVGNPNVSITGKYGTPIIEYYAGDKKLNGKPTEVGNYTIVVTYLGNENFNDATVTKSFVITKAPSTTWQGTFVAEPNVDTNLIELILVESGIVNGEHNGQKVQYAAVIKGYTLIDGDWQDDCLFEGLAEGTEYDIYIKFLGNDNVEESAPIYIDTIKTASKTNSGSSVGASTGNGGHNISSTGAIVGGSVGGGLSLLGLIGGGATFAIKRKKKISVEI